LHFLAAVQHVVDRLAANLGSVDDVVEQFPFISEYLEELDGVRLPEAIRAQEARAGGHLPLRALRDTLGLDERTQALLMAIGLIEEDARFGFLIESAQTPGQQRPTMGLLTAWWRAANEHSPVRESIATLMDHGLVQVVNGDAPRLLWTFQSPPAVWDALRGDRTLSPLGGMTYVPLAQLPRLEDLVLPDAVRRLVAAMPVAFAAGDARTVIVRGPQHNGRRTVVRAIAAAMGRGVLEIRGPVRADEERWLQASALATLLDVLPVICLDLGLGETCEIPRMRGYAGPLAVVARRHGAIAGDAVDGALTLPLDMPGPAERRALWIRSLGDEHAETAAGLAERLRTTSGNIRRAAALARSQAALDHRRTVTAGDVRTGSRTLHREIERLATFVPAAGGWESLAAAPDTVEELRSLESRCRQRERLHAHVGPSLAHQLTCGVRALFAGPSGTGKTMAARLLASTLDMDLYRLDLASVVNKYIGETEKSLDQLFARAEELDVILLIDEGDALLTGRTAVQTSNDRYANLETNYLLQRLESYEGVLIVTTNAASRIDSAFQRRMDVVVDFRMPGPHDRWLIWQLHLPLDHDVDSGWLQEAAVRCALSGGQIRNAVLHASLAALDGDRRLHTGDVERALEREYRKTGTICPLPRHAFAV
jgi:hypothetical protein